MSKKSKFPKVYGQQLIDEINVHGLPWIRVGAVILNGHNEVCLIEEAKAKGDDGEYHDVYDVWNIVGGRCAPGEALSDALAREILEETGFKVINTFDVVHVGYRTDPDNPYVIIVFLVHFDGKVGEPDPKEVRSVRWYKLDDVRWLAEAGKLRNTELVMGAIDNTICRLSNTSIFKLLCKYPSKT